ncbi:MAG: hypothetical protein R3D68_15010 [Hyphomicrobiaceae bacterium]
MALARELSMFDSLESSDMGEPKATSATFGGMLKKALSAFKVRRADSDVERYINTHGGVLTDEMERQISRRFGAMVD